MANNNRYQNISLLVFWGTVIVTVLIILVFFGDAQYWKNMQLGNSSETVGKSDRNTQTNKIADVIDTEPKVFNAEMIDKAPYETSEELSGDRNNVPRLGQFEDWEYMEYCNHIVLTNYYGDDEILQVPEIILEKPVTVLDIKDSPLCFRHISEVNMPSIEYISHSHTFSGCEKLRSIYAPNLRYVVSNTFARTPIVEIHLPKLEQLTPSIFEACYDLEEVFLPGVVSVDTFSFAFCYQLESISLPSTTVIKNDAFYGCRSLQKVIIPKIETLEQGAFNCANKDNLQVYAGGDEYNHSSS